MGIFSSPPPLDARFQAALSPYFTANIGGEYKTGLKKLAEAQGKLSETLQNQEHLLRIFPGFSKVGFEGLAVVTAQRVFLLKRRLEKQLAATDIVEIEKSVSSSGHFMALLITKTALPYSGFRSRDLSNKSTLLFWENSLLLHVSTPQILEDLSSIVESVSQ